MSLNFNSIPTKTLSESITSAATSFKLNNITGWDGVDLVAGDFGTVGYGVFVNANKTQIELFEFDPATIASASITINKRGLKFTGDLTTEVTGNKFSWTKGDTYVNLGTDSPQVFQYLKEYIDGVAIAGSPDAALATKGITKLSVAPASAGNPIAVGDNDPRVPSTTGAAFVSAVTGMISMYASATPPTGFLLCNGQAVSRTTYADLFAITGTSYGVGNGSTTFNVPNLASRFPLGYSASAPTKVLTFASRSSNLITVTGADDHANNELQTGQAVVYTSSGSVITGLTSGNTYYLIRNAYNQFSLATSVANANAGTVITLSSDGSGTQTFTITYTVRPLAQMGGEETHALTDSQMPSHSHFVNYQVSTNGVEAAWAEPAADPSATKNSTDSAGSDTPHNIIPLFTVVNYIIKT